MTRGLEMDVVVRRGEAFRLDLALAIPPGRTVALLGPNGAGKSTTVAAIAGLLPVESGRITLDGTVLDDADSDTFVPADQRRVGVVFQDYLLFPHLTALQNVAFGLRSRKLGRDEANARSQHWLDRLGVGDLADRRPEKLSGGQAQRVALARALATEPRLLLLDEPLSALDVTTRTTMRRTLSEHLAAFEGPRLLITHDPTEAFLLAEEVHVVEHGGITQAGTPDDLRLRPRTPYVADLAGSNFLVGEALQGVVSVDGHVLHVPDPVPDGEVVVTIHPSAVSVHRHQPEGSARNTWQTIVERVEPLGTRVRVLTGSPLPLTVEVTESARADLGLEPGSQVWVAVKATEIRVGAG